MEKPCKILSPTLKMPGSYNFNKIPYKILQESLLKRIKIIISNLFSVKVKERKEGEIPYGESSNA